MDASFAPQYIFLLKWICIMSHIALHGSIFSMVFDWKIKSRAVRKPLPSHQERCLAPRNRYAASPRPETVTILQRVCSTKPFVKTANQKICSFQRVKKQGLLKILSKDSTFIIYSVISILICICISIELRYSSSIYAVSMVDIGYLGLDLNW